jgi:hypothetical protein
MLLAVRTIMNRSITMHDPHPFHWLTGVVLLWGAVIGLALAILVVGLVTTVGHGALR